MRFASVLALLALPVHVAFAQFDHTPSKWSALLARHVVVLEGGEASQVRRVRAGPDRAQGVSRLALERGACRVRRLDPAKNALEVSKIFDWFREDWQSGYCGIGKDAAPIASREQFFAKYADILAASPEGRQAVRDRKAAIVFLEYDWMLNDARP